MVDSFHPGQTYREGHTSPPIPSLPRSPYLWQPTGATGAPFFPYLPLLPPHYHTPWPPTGIRTPTPPLLPARCCAAAGSGLRRRCLLRGAPRLKLVFKRVSSSPSLQDKGVEGAGVKGPTGGGGVFLLGGRRPPRRRTEPRDSGPGDPKRRPPSAHPHPHGPSPCSLGLGLGGALRSLRERRTPRGMIAREVGV